MLISPHVSDNLCAHDCCAKTISSGKYTAQLQGITKSCILLQNLKCNNLYIYSYRCGMFIKCTISCDI